MYKLTPNILSINEIEQLIDKGITGLCIWPRVANQDLAADNFNGFM